MAIATHTDPKSWLTTDDDPLLATVLAVLAEQAEQAGTKRKGRRRRRGR